MPYPIAAVRGKNFGSPTIPWYLSGGIAAANCAAAYLAKGADSYAASKSNLANPETYDLTDSGTPPSWAALTGWQFSNSANWLNTGIVIPSHEWSMFVAGQVPLLLGNSNFCGTYNDLGGYFAITLESGTYYVYNMAGRNCGAPSLFNVVIGYAGYVAYKDGAVVGDIYGSGTPETMPPLHLGGVAFTEDGESYVVEGTESGLYVASFAIYDSVLSESQAIALMTAMAAHLPAEP